MPLTGSPVLAPLLCAPRAPPTAARAQVDVRSLRVENAPRAALEVARSDSVALMGLNVSAGHGAGIVVDGSQHVYIGGSAVDAAGDALVVQASTGARAGAWAAGFGAPRGRPWRAHGVCASHREEAACLWERSAAAPAEALRGRAVGRPTSFLFVDGVMLASRAAAVLIGGDARADISSLVLQNLAILPSRRRAPAARRPAPWPARRLALSGAAPRAGAWRSSCATRATSRPSRSPTSRWRCSFTTATARAVASRSM